VRTWIGPSLKKLIRLWRVPKQICNNLLLWGSQSRTYCKGYGIEWGFIRNMFPGLRIPLSLPKWWQNFGNKSFMHPMKMFSLHLWRVQFFLFEGGGEGGFCFMPCSLCIPFMFSWGSQVPKLFPQKVPNSTSGLLFHMVCPKFNFHVCFLWLIVLSQIST